MSSLPPYTPPKWATRFFHWYCPHSLREEIEGDLLESFASRHMRKGLKAARRRYILDVIRFCNPTTFQRARRLRPERGAARLIRLDMLYNYWLVVWRTIRRRPLYSTLTISGLTIGMAASLFILLYVHFELNFDQFHERSDEIYRITTRSIVTHEKTMEVNWDGVPGNLGPLMQAEFPELESFMRHYSLFQDERVSLEYGEKRIEEAAVHLVDSTVFELFTFPFVAGEPETALRGPNKIVLSQDLTRRIFGLEDPIGKVLTSSSTIALADVDTALSFVVTGVFQNMPRNTHWYAHALISAETDPALSQHYFNRFGFNTYVTLHPGADTDKFATKLSTLYDKHLDVEREPVLKRAIHQLTPLNRVHLEETEGMLYVYIIGGVGILLLLISAISYVNMATAQASRRVLEVGLRKVLGSHRLQLVGQFLAESLLFTFVSIVLGICLLVGTIDPLNELLGLHLDIDQLKQGQVVTGVMGIFVLLGLVAGSYPAFVLSGFKPLSALKGQWSKGRNRQPVRKLLVAVQFAVVMFVLLCTGMIYDQLRYIRQKELGFDQEHVVQLTLPAKERAARVGALRNALAQSPWIETVSTSSFVPGSGIMRGPISVETPSGPIQNFAGRGWVDPEFWEGLEIELVEGRNFIPEMSTDTTQAVIVNEALVREYGLNKPIGTRIRLGDQGNPHFFEVIGVSRDFHQLSLHEAIMPQTIFLGGDWMPHVLVKVGGDLRAGMDAIESSWLRTIPEAPFAYRFIDEMMQENYETDRIRGRVFIAFSVLTLFIAFLGLFGLASYMATQRIREVGIRKVLGAGNWQLIALMTREFLIWVMLASIPAFSGAWYLMREWLENFAFRTEIHASRFVMVLLLTLLITALTTGVHALRTAQLNPADTLRGE